MNKTLLQGHDLGLIKLSGIHHVGELYKTAAYGLGKNLMGNNILASDEDMNKGRIVYMLPDVISVNTKLDDKINFCIKMFLIYWEIF